MQPTVTEMIANDERECDTDTSGPRLCFVDYAMPILPVFCLPKKTSELGMSSVQSLVQNLSPVIFRNDSGSSVEFSHTKLYY